MKQEHPSERQKRKWPEWQPAEFFHSIWVNTPDLGVMWHPLIDRSLLQKLIISLSAIIHLEDWLEIWFVRGSWSHRCVRRRHMITYYKHFISSFLHMLMLIFLSIDATLQWPADGVTRSSKVWKVLRQWWRFDDDAECKQANLCFIACLS